MITTNIDIFDRIMNEQIGTAKHRDKKQAVSTISLLWEDTFSGRTIINGNDIIAKNNRWVPIEVSIGSLSGFLSKYKTTSLPVQRTQFSLILSWRCTVSQGPGFGF